MARYEAEANPDVPNSYNCPHCYGTIDDLGDPAPEWTEGQG